MTNRYIEDNEDGHDYTSNRGQSVIYVQDQEDKRDYTEKRASTGSTGPKGHREYTGPLFIKICPFFQTFHCRKQIIQSLT
jgi:hypothetical protein